MDRSVRGRNATRRSSKEHHKRLKKPTHTRKQIQKLLASSEDSDCLDLCDDDKDYCCYCKVIVVALVFAVVVGIIFFFAIRGIISRNDRANSSPPERIVNPPPPDLGRMMWEEKEEGREARLEGEELLWWEKRAARSLIATQRREDKENTAVIVTDCDGSIRRSIVRDILGEDEGQKIVCFGDIPIDDLREILLGDEDISDRSADLYYFATDKLVGDEKGESSFLTNLLTGAAVESDSAIGQLGGIRGIIHLTEFGVTEVSTTRLSPSHSTLLSFIKCETEKQRCQKKILQGTANILQALQKVYQNCNHPRSGCAKSPLPWLVYLSTLEVSSSSPLSYSILRLTISW